MAGHKKVKEVVEVEIRSGALDDVVAELLRIKARLAKRGCTEFEVETSVEQEYVLSHGDATFHYVNTTVTGR